MNLFKINKLIGIDLNSFGIDYDSGEGHPGIEAHEELSEQLFIVLIRTII